MKNKLREFMCTCGHAKKDHKEWGKRFGTTRCEECAKPFLIKTRSRASSFPFVQTLKDGTVQSYQSVLKSWHNCKQDNLKYLEDKYKEKCDNLLRS